MDKHFNFHRFILVVRKFWFENGKTIFFMQMAIMALLTIWLGVYLSFTNARLFREDFQIAYYFVGLLISGCLSANFLFSDLNNKSRAINFLLTPASSLEKTVCVLFFGVIIFLMGYTISFYLVDSIMVTLANALNDTHWSIINIFSMSQFRDPLFDGAPGDLFFKYFTCQALFILGSLFFPKYSFFKTVIVLFFVWIVLFFLQGFIRVFLPAGMFNTLSEFVVFDYRASKRVEMPEWFATSFTIFSFYLITLVLWIASYFRLNEKEAS